MGHPTTEIKYKRAISPVSVADNTALVSQIIDCTGARFCEFIIETGSLADADATFAVLVEDGDAANLSDAAAVADDYLQGTEAAAGFTFADDNEIRRILYRPQKKYVRLTIAPSANASAAVIAAFAALSGFAYLPITQPES